jgi:hypothetical protein
MEPLNNLPGRLFLDSSTLQALQTYGEYIYDGGYIDANNSLWSIPNGYPNIEALRQIMFVGQRANFELVLSSNSLREVADRMKHDYLQWAYEIVAYMDGLLSVYKAEGRLPFTGVGKDLAERVTPTNFGYLSHKDLILIRDALLLECEAFLTMDRKLKRNAPHIERELGLKVLEPTDYWTLLEPWDTLSV